MSVQKNDDKTEYEPDPINLRNFKKYLRKNGTERALGYLDALEHVNQNIESLFYHFDTNMKDYEEASPNRVKTKLTDFKSKTELVVKEIKESKLISDTPRNTNKEENTPR